MKINQILTEGKESNQHLKVAAESLAAEVVKKQFNVYKRLLKDEEFKETYPKFFDYIDAALEGDLDELFEKQFQMLENHIIRATKKLAKSMK